MKVISLQVKDETAEKIEQLSAERKEQLSRFIEIWISEPKPILQVMEELGEYATKQGLTEDKLRKLLSDE
ncbi:MAG TPA: hypothetical protein VHO90_18380 [Bacteroidales bacterium]|nr:hypothetical protein [Bacteroidales bacterium]